MISAGGGRGRSSRGWRLGAPTVTITAVTVEPPSSAAPIPRDSAEGNGRSWAHDLVETPAGELRKRRLRRIAIGFGGVLVVVALVVGVVVNLRDSGSEVAYDSVRPHDEALSSYMIPAPAGALPPPSLPASRDLDEVTAAEVSGGSRLLRRYKFSYGYERRWLQEDVAVVTVRLLRFRGAENAAYYLRDSLDSSVIGVDVRQKAVAGIVGAGPSSVRHLSVVQAARL